jgi:nitrogen fixation/metabolism regulation signal transduction histidine kinase
MTVGQVSAGDNTFSLLQTIFENCPFGMILLEQDRVILANPVAARLLSPRGDLTGQRLRLDGPDGPLGERIAETASSTSSGRSFEYHIPMNDEHGERSLKLTVVPLGSRMLACIEDVSANRRSESRWHEAVSHAFHELKTPVAVLSLGLSNLSTYYERLPDEERRLTIDELAEHVREMSRIMSDLQAQIKALSKGEISGPA